MVLTSQQNEKIKMLKKLMTDKSYVFFDNPKLLLEAQSAGHKVEYLIVRENSNVKTDYGGEVVVVSENVFNSFKTTINSQGIIGVVKYISPQVKLPSGNFLVLDNLQDPGNIGTLIRSALGANFKDIYLLDCVKPTNEKVVRSSMGAIFKTNLYQMTKNEFLNFATNNNLNLAVCDMNGENIFTTNIAKPVGIIVGNEGNGVEKELKNMAKITLKIPMQNNLESLNAGVSGSIIMYQISNKN